MNAYSWWAQVKQYLKTMLNDGETAQSCQCPLTATGERWIGIIFEGMIAQFDLEYVIFNSSYNLDSVHAYRYHKKIRISLQQFDATILEGVIAPFWKFRKFVCTTFTFVMSFTRRMPLVEQELLTLPEFIPVLVGFVLLVL